MERTSSLFLILWALIVLLLQGCSTEDATSTQTSSTPTILVGYYIDMPVTNIEYQCGSASGWTDRTGKFYFEKGKGCRFSIGDILLHQVDASKLNQNGIILFENDPIIAAFLLSLDQNHLYGDNIYLSAHLSSALKYLNITTIPITDSKREDAIKKINQYLHSTYQAVRTTDAILHLKQSLSSYRNQTLLFLSSTQAWQSSTIQLETGREVSVDDHSNEAETQEPTTGDINLTTQTDWVTTTRIYTSEQEPQKPIETNDYTLIAWSELGMHCMDGTDYSVFSLLPPYSTLKAQLLINGASPRIVSSDVNITYEAVAKENGGINTGSKNKTNFWQYVEKLFPDITPTPSEDYGLTGTPVQQELPSAMEFNMTQNLFVAEGIPTVPLNDDNSYDEYPTVKVVAKDHNGNILAQTTTTLPVSDEMDCMRCHSSRMDVLQKHDRNYPNAVRDYDANLTTKGFHYDTRGLEATATNGTPVLCAACHSSNAIAHSGISGIKPLTEAIHGAHADRVDQNTGTSLNNTDDRSSCYACHPGESTKCLRGAMGTSKKIECQSCHGNMQAVAKHGRKSWVDEPNCQSCHQEGRRHTEAVTDMTSGTLRDAIDKRFATEQTMLEPHHPRLYKFSTSHGGVGCAACHGAQHAIYPSALPEENQQNITLQGYAGTLRECGVCHKNEKIPTISDGPHGMHSIGQPWVDMHGSIVLRNGTNDCKVCHGQNLEGTFLSETGTTRTFKLGVTQTTVTFEAKERVSCQKCHTTQSEGEN